MPLSIERDTAKRTILVLHERRSPDARGLETKQRHPSLVNDVGTVRFVFIQVGEAIRLLAGWIQPTVKFVKALPKK